MYVSVMGFFVIIYLMRRREVLTELRKSYLSLFAGLCGGAVFLGREDPGALFRQVVDNIDEVMDERLRYKAK